MTGLQLKTLAGIVENPNVGGAILVVVVLGGVVLVKAAIR